MMRSSNYFCLRFLAFLCLAVWCVLEGLVPALAGSAAAVAGLAQQLMGAVGGYAVGLVPHEGAVNLGWLMLGLGSVALVAQVVLNRRRVVKPAPVRSPP